MLRATWRWLRRGLTLGMLLLLLVRLLPADPHPVDRRDAGPTPPSPPTRASPSTPTASPAKPAPICSSTPTTPSTGIPGAPEAFAKAKKEGKLVFLSIGYSSCHWCHVMERESFANEEVAKILNEHFVCIKVDREERPDIDHIYMTALQRACGQRGGWPLSMFLTADGKPIVGGTYWPPEDKEIDGEKVRGFKTHPQARAATSARTSPRTSQEQADEAGRGHDRRAGRRWLAASPSSTLDRDLVDGAVDGAQGGVRPESRRLRLAGAAVPRHQVPDAAVPGCSCSTRPAATKSKELDDMVDAHARPDGPRRHLRPARRRLPSLQHRTHLDRAALREDALRQRPARRGLRRRLPADEEAAVSPRAASRRSAFVGREMTAPEGGFYSALDADARARKAASTSGPPKEIDAVLADKDRRGRLFKQGLRRGRRAELRGEVSHSDAAAVRSPSRRRS